MTQSQAEEILDQQVEQLRDLDEQLQSLSAQHTDTRDALTNTLAAVDKLRPEAAVKAREAAVRAESGGRDMIEAEAQCEWHRSAIQLWRELFNLESVKAVSNNELWLVYAKPRFTLALVFDHITHKFAGARVSRSLSDPASANSPLVDRHRYEHLRIGRLGHHCQQRSSIDQRHSLATASLSSRFN